MFQRFFSALFLSLSVCLPMDAANATTTNEGAPKAAKTTGQLNTATTGDLVKFSYRDADVSKVIEDYSKATGQQFILDSSVRGKVNIINPGPINKEEAFNQLSTALASNGIAISTQGNVMYVAPARSIQRNYIPVVTTLPPLKPERMYTWIIQLQNADADDVNKQLRILTSKDGELVPYVRTNQILVSDWTSNLQRIAELVKEIDKPVANRKK
jgi:type II secretory pathway component GspD/PulD (secretin)